MLDKITIPVERLKAGMKIAREIENKFGTILINKEVVVTAEIIAKLKVLGISQIVIYKEKENEFEQDFEYLKRTYNKEIKVMKKLFNSFKESKSLEYGELNSIFSDLSDFDNNKNIVKILSKVREKDEYTYVHSVNVGLLALMFARWLNLPEKDIKKLVYGGLLHDIGKSKISDDILNKRGELDPTEFEEMKKHPIYGYKLLKDYQYICSDVSSIVLLHHERNDGSGYPFKLKAEKIPFMVKIIAIIDTFDAMTSERVYQNSQAAFEVFKVFEQDSFRKFDIQLLKIFIKNIVHYYQGEKVVLSNGEKGEIIFINPNHLSQPIVKIGDKYIDIYNSNLEIVSSG